MRELSLVADSLGDSPVVACVLLTAVAFLAVSVGSRTRGLSSRGTRA